MFGVVVNSVEECGEAYSKGQSLRSVHLGSSSRLTRLD